MEKGEAMFKRELYPDLYRICVLNATSISIEFV